MKRLGLLPACLLLGAVPAPEERLVALWQARHPGQAAPASCGEDDRVRVASVDGRPVAASLRWGLAWLDAGDDGDAARAGWRELGCDPQRGGQVLSLEAVQARPGRIDLAVRTRRAGHCGAVTDWTLYDRALAPLLTVDEAVDRQCGAAPEEHRRTPISVERGRVRAGDHEWRWDGARFRDSEADRRRR